MSDADAEQTPPRAGTYADLSRRMDRMENRHEDLVEDVRNLSVVVSDVRKDVQHAAELAKLRFDAVELTMKHGFDEAGAHRQRIESIINGDVVTPQAKLIMDQYRQFTEQSIADRKSLNHRVELLEEDHIKRDASRSGIFMTLGGAKGALLLLAALASPLITILALIAQHP